MMFTVMRGQGRSTWMFGNGSGNDGITIKNARVSRVICIIRRIMESPLKCRIRRGDGVRNGKGNVGVAI